MLRASSRAAQADAQVHPGGQGVGQEWAPLAYGEYLARSVPVYGAVRIRAESMGRLRWKVVSARTGEEVVPEHPARRIMDNPNPWFSPAELRYALEVQLMVYGRGFLAVEHGENGRTELWPVRADRMTVVPGQGRRGPYIRGYLYRSPNGQDLPYLPEEVEMFRLYNPLEDLVGLSPMAPLRLSADMGIDAVRFNRETFRTGAVPDYFMLADTEMTEQQVQDFYRRWEQRYSGPRGMRRPAIASGIREVQGLMLSQRDMEFVASLKWTVADASRVFGVPVTMMGDLEQATLANMEGLEKHFWRNTMLPHAGLLSDRLSLGLLPKLGFVGLRVEHDASSIEVLGDSEENRRQRETEFLDRGVLTINEVRRSRGLPDVAWGNEPRQPSAVSRQPSEREDRERGALLEHVLGNGLKADR